MTDDSLIARARTGDADAFGHLVTRHQAMVYAVAFATLRQKEAAEDAAQEAFVTAWQRLGQLREAARFGPWLRTIARRTAAEHAVRLVRESERRRELAREPGPAEASAQPDDAAAAREEEALLGRALDRIPPRYRDVVVLYYQEDRRTPEVAAQLGISEAAARQRLVRGRGYLRAELEDTIERGLRRRRPGEGLKAAVLAGITGLGTTGCTTGAAGTAYAGMVSLAAALFSGAAGIAILLVVEGWLMLISFLFFTIMLALLVRRGGEKALDRQITVSGAASLFGGALFLRMAAGDQPTDWMLVVWALVMIGSGVMMLLPGATPLLGRKAREWRTPVVKPEVLFSRLRPDTFPYDTWKRIVRTCAFWSVVFSGLLVWWMFEGAPVPMLLVPGLMAAWFLFNALRFYLFAKRQEKDTLPS